MVQLKKKKKTQSQEVKNKTVNLSGSPDITDKVLIFFTDASAWISGGQGQIQNRNTFHSMRTSMTLLLVHAKPIHGCLQQYTKSLPKT